MATDIITLDVSGTKLKTTRSTLEYSRYFKALLSEAWNDGNGQQQDGSYFVDADPETFPHILNFLRHPAKFPLFWTKETGFDYALYNKLEAAADFFCIDDLRSWIRNERYKGAVKTRFSYVYTNSFRGEEKKSYEADANFEFVFVGRSESTPSQCPIVITKGYEFDASVCRNE